MRIGYFSALLAVAVLLLGHNGTARAQDPVEETIEQVTRLISNSITRRLGQEIGAAAIEVQEVRDMTVWTSGGYTNIELDGSGGFGTEIEITQWEIGFDRQFGDFVFGASAGYSHSGLDLPAGIPFDFSSNSINFSPYASLQINENFFVAGLFGYTATNLVGSNMDSESIFGQLSGNGVFVVDDFTISGEAAYRVFYSETDNVLFGDDDSVTHVLAFGTQVAYQATPEVKPFVSATYEHAFTEDSADSDDLFLGAGVEIALSEATFLTLSGEAEAINDDTNQYSAVVELSFSF